MNKNRKTLLGLILVALVAVAGYFAWTRLARKKLETEGNIKIGAIFSQTGVAGDYGKKSVEGLLLAVDMLNERGGINGHPIEVVLEDAKSSSKDAVSAFNGLILKGIKYIIGDIYSSTTKAIIPKLNSDILLFAPGASRPDLTNLSPNFIRNWTSDDFDGLAMSKVIQSMGIRKIAVLAQHNEYTLGLKEAFTKDFCLSGGEVNDVGLFSEELVSLKDQLIKLKEAKVLNVYLIGMSKQIGYILGEAKRIGFNPQWFTNLTVNTQDCLDIAGTSVNGVIFSQPYVDRESKTWVNFKKSYEKKYNKEPDASSAHSFDAMNILALALSESDGNEPQEVANRIKRIKKYIGVSGITSFDESGNVVKDIEILQFVDKQPKNVKIFEF